MSTLDKWYNPVKTLNMNDDNEGERYDVSTDFIRKLTSFFFISISEKAMTNISLSKMYPSRRVATLTCLSGTIFLDFDYYPPYSDENLSFLIYTFIETWDVFIDISIA